MKGGYPGTILATETRRQRESRAGVAAAPAASRGACSPACPAAPCHVPPWQQLSATAGILMRAGQSLASLSPLSCQEL